jgi:plastocyanin
LNEGATVSLVNSSSQKEQKKMKKILIVAMFVLALTLTACGSNKVTLNVTATDTGYDSATYTVPAGKEVTLNMTNNGVLEHEFAILKLGEHVIPPFGEKDEDKILWELDGVQAGTSKSATFTAPTEPGEYDVICGIPGHIEKGMVATLIVK